MKTSMQEDRPRHFGEKEPESLVMRKYPAGFGKGVTEKAREGPRRYPTSFGKGRLEKDCLHETTRGFPGRSEERTAPRRPPTSSKRPRRERTHEWEKIKQWTLWPEQQLYEQLRPKSRPLTRSHRFTPCCLR